MTRVSDLLAVMGVLSRLSYRFSNEADLQDGVEKALRSAGIAFERERVLPGGLGRIDFLTAGGTGIEVKYFGCSIAELSRQVHRYTESDDIDAVVVVSARLGHSGAERTMNKKPVRFVHAAGPGGAF